MPPSFRKKGKDYEVVPAEQGQLQLKFIRPATKISTHEASRAKDAR